MSSPLKRDMIEPKTKARDIDEHIRVDESVSLDVGQLLLQKYKPLSLFAKCSVGAIITAAFVALLKIFFVVVLLT